MTLQTFIALPTMADQSLLKIESYMDDFQGMNKVYEEMFQGHKPKCTTISIKKNPLNALVEIECIAELRS